MFKKPRGFRGQWWGECEGGQTKKNWMLTAGIFDDQRIYFTDKVFTLQSK